MSAQNCTHVFSECSDECTSIVHRIDAMTAGHDKARAELTRSIKIAAVVAGALIFGGVLGAIAFQGVENNRQTIIQNERV